MLVEITTSNEKCSKCACYFYGKLKEKGIIILLPFFSYKKEEFFYIVCFSKG